MTEDIKKELESQLKSLNSEEIKRRINSISASEKLDELYNHLLGRKGKITSLLRRVKELPQEYRREFGSLLNNLKEELTSLIKERKDKIEQEELHRILKEEKIDVTMVEKNFLLLEGHLHPITKVLQEIHEVFLSLGFEIVEGPEVEDEYHNFEALNVPAEHPARDKWDTYYLRNKMLLRTHTSAMQIRYMKKHKPPFKIIVPGRCYRYESVDATHLDVFNQLEGLMVDKNISFSDLKGVLSECVKRLLGENLKLRFRPAYYPFVEPGADLDVECIFCSGKGCEICKFTGWIELIPCGMVHPKVFINVGYNKDEFVGFAFGMGFDRMVMLKFGINDLRLLYQGDIRVLSQF